MDTLFIKSKVKPCYKELTLLSEPFPEGWCVSQVHCMAGSAAPTVLLVLHSLIRRPWYTGVHGSPATSLRLTVGIYLHALWCCLTQHVEDPRGDRVCTKDD